MDSLDQGSQCMFDYSSLNFRLLDMREQFERKLEQEKMAAMMQMQEGKRILEEEVG